MAFGLTLALAPGLMFQARAQVPWVRPVLGEPNRVEMGGVWGEAYQRGLTRIGRDPFTVPLVLADVNFGMNRWFTNYSGDISGRFIELASATSSREHPQPPVLAPVMDQITQYQKPDGHYGAAVDWSQPVDMNTEGKPAKMMPILWGNGRLLLGLIAAYERFGDPRLLGSARKLGDFYANVVVGRFCDPRRTDEYHRPADYAGNYVTCVFQGIEGLVRLYRVTREPDYLGTARRMADFHEPFDTLPVDHSHGSISVHEALLMLYEETGETKYLKRVTERWGKAVSGGYVNPAGGVLEKFWVTGYNRDEGCSEADWLRLNLALWRHTGQTRYLDMAERLLWSGYLANQWPSGGFGHRLIGCDGQGPYAYQNPDQESLWCCSFHCPLALHKLKGYLAVGDKQGIRYHFPVDFKAPVQVGSDLWTVTSKLLPETEGVPVRCEVSLDGPSDKPVALMIRIPEWAAELGVKQAGRALALVSVGGYARLNEPLPSGAKLEVVYRGRPFLEDRRLKRIEWSGTPPAARRQVVVRYGPHVLMAVGGGTIPDLTLLIGQDGGIELPKDDAPVKLAPWYRLPNPVAPHAFVFNARIEPAPSR